MSPHNKTPSGLSTDEIQQKYNAFAPWYDLWEGLPELLGVRRLRRDLLQRAAENALEVAVGTGKNLPYYPISYQLTAVDVSPAMLALARKRATCLGRYVTFQVMDVKYLAFPDHHFHTVVDTLAVCTFLHPVAALCEMARVCNQGDGSCSWSTAVVTEHGWDGGKTVGQRAMPPSSVAGGTGSHLLSSVKLDCNH